MPFSTGTARTPSELLKAFNTHLVANGWTKIRGETDINAASPRSARYWRMVVWETQTTNTTTRGVQLFNLRTTVGGANVATVAANFTVSDISVGTTALLISGGVVRSANIGASRAWTITYDFGVATTIRECYWRADSSASSTPRSYAIQWSNDNETWTTLYQVDSAVIAANAYTTINWPDGYLSPLHPNAAAARRSGGSDDFLADFNWEASGFRDFSQDIWIWQGPGYDASRRVYAHMRGHSSPATSTNFIELNYSPLYDAAQRAFLGQAGMSPTSTFHMYGTGTITYWIYSNSKRIIIITLTGASEYSMSYLGFMSAFATPDYYPFPLLASAGAPDRNYTMGVSDNFLSVGADPGFGCLKVRKWDGVNYSGGNRNVNSSDGFQYSGTSSPFPFAWPYYFGKSGTNSRFPYNRGSGSSGSLYTFGTLIAKLQPTVQNDLPLIPVTIMDHNHGNLGVMDGVFAVPGGGIVTAQQALTIAGVNYRIFPNRTRRDTSSWFAVRED